MQQSTGTEDVAQRLTQLEEEHQEIHRQLDELETHLSFSQRDEGEIRRLKKLKLQKKDQIAYYRTMSA